MKNQRRGCRLYSVEIPTVGHSDKIADYISNSVLSYILSKDRNSKVAIETMVTGKNIYLAGEVSTSCSIDYESIVKDALKEIGYTDFNILFNYKDINVIVDIKEQSEEVSQIIDRGGAGNQCIIMGGAWSETDDYMPLSVTLARVMTIKLKELAETTKDNEFKFYPDGKVTVTLAYDRDRKPIGVDTVIVNIARTNNFTRDKLLNLIKEEVIYPTLLEYGFELDSLKKCFVNSAGNFNIHGPLCDTGVSGRKTVSDMYGLHLPFGGSSIVGKDLTKTDTVATLFARYIAKNIVAAGLASTCEIQLTYSIGTKTYTSINLNMFGTNKYIVGIISKALYSLLDFSTEKMIERLNIPSDFRYQDLDVYGVFGELGNIDRVWEHLDLAEPLKKLVEELNDSSQSDI